MKKIWDFLKNFVIIAYILLIIFVTICLLSYNNYKVTVFGKNTVLPIIDEDLEPNYTVGDLLIISRNNLSTVKEGDVIFFYRTIAGETIINYAPVIKAEKVSDVEVTYTVEGDYTFSSSYFIGKVDTATTVPKLGRVLGILESKWGFLFLGVFPSLIAFLYTVRSVIVELQDNEENKKEGQSSKKKAKKSKEEKIKNSNEENKVIDNEEKPEEKIAKEETKEFDGDSETASTKENKEEKIEEKQEEKEVEVKKEKSEEPIKKLDEETKAEDEEPIKKLDEKTSKDSQKGNDSKTEKDTDAKSKLTEEQRKALIEAKMKTMTEEQKRALIEAKLKTMTDEQKRALIEAKRRKLEADKNKD